ncbi:MAG: hypothetical protein ACR2O8_09450 [Rhizobiaceae bacterium]
MTGHSKSMLKTLIGLSFIALLAGCSSSTYGTGVSSTNQLYQDVSGIVSLSSDEKKRINYNSRPKLVTPPLVAELPAPAEKIEAESAYFPEDPEVKRARMLAELDEKDGVRASNKELSPEIEAMREESRKRNQLRSQLGNQDGDCYLCDYYERMKIDNQRSEQRTAQVQQPTIPTRKYLTQPPTEYRVPAETAPIGVMGEEENGNAGVPNKKQKGLLDGLLDPIFGQ